MTSDAKTQGPADTGRHSPQLRAVGALLPTPVVNDMGEGKSVEVWDGWTADLKARHGNGNGHGASLAVEAARSSEPASDAPWGPYAAAVARWEAVTGQPAPTATERNWHAWRQRRAKRFASRAPIGHRGSVRSLLDPPPRRLSAAFVEWMMGLPAGHVTGVPGVGRNQQLKALGNGVVPQQAALAVGELLAEAPGHVRDRLGLSGL